MTRGGDEVVDSFFFFFSSLFRELTICLFVLFCKLHSVGFLLLVACFNNVAFWFLVFFLLATGFLFILILGLCFYYGRDTHSLCLQSPRISLSF